MKITLKGIVNAVNPVITKTSGTQSFRIQTMIIKVPGYRDQFGDQVGKDEFWQIEIYNDHIEKHNLLAANLLDKKIELNGYLNSRTFKKDGEDFYQLSIRLADYKLFN